jgi:L-Ala-D/L-Glu epimerase
VLTVHATLEVAERPLNRSFQVSFTRTDMVDVLVLRLCDRHGAELGLGEVAADAKHDQDSATYARQATALATRLCDEPPSDPAALDAVLRTADVEPPVRMLVEMAFLDHLARRAGLPVWRLVGLPEPGLVRLMTTVPIGEPVPTTAGPLKVKLGGPTDASLLRELAGAPGPLILDVNSGWAEADWYRLRDLVRPLRPAVLEDPVADLSLLPRIRADLPETTLVLDKAVHDEASIESAARVAGGANVKLMRVGGLAAARRGFDLLAAAGATPMLGCFLEPPRAIAYAAQLAGRCEWTDLDGHFWLTDTPAVTEYRLDSSVPGIPRIAP